MSDEDNPTFIMDGKQWFICRPCHKYFSAEMLCNHIALKHHHEGKKL